MIQEVQHLEAEVTTLDREIKGSSFWVKYVNGLNDIDNPSNLQNAILSSNLSSARIKLNSTISASSARKTSSL